MTIQSLLPSSSTISRAMLACSGAVLFTTFACSTETDPVLPHMPIEGTVSSLSRQTERQPWPSARSKHLGYLSTSPNASCQLWPTTGSASVKGGALADSRGVVRFTPPPEDWGTLLSVECTSPSTGATTNHSIDLTSPNTFVPPTAATEPLASRVLPPLTGDLERLSDDELSAEGYPRRPARSSAQYETWRAGVSKPLTIVDSQPIARLGAFNNSVSYNWSGPVLAQSSTTYTAGVSVFAIPYLNTIVDDQSYVTLASIWVGLGGTLNQALIQAGVNMWDGGAIDPEFGPWIEYFPNNWIDTCLGTGGQGGCGVSEGDVIWDQVWACNSATTMSATGGWGCFSLWNTTTNVSSGTLKISAPATFGGETVESILETPAIYNQPLYYPLTDFSSASAWWWAYDSSSVEHQLSTDSQYTYDMYNIYNHTTLLASAANTGDAVTDWTFHAAQ